MNADGSEPVRLTTFPGQDTKPTWSPTGDRIAFHRQIAGHLQVYTMNADGTGDTQITFTATPRMLQRLPQLGQMVGAAAVSELQISLGSGRLRKSIEGIRGPERVLGQRFRC